MATLAGGESRCERRVCHTHLHISFPGGTTYLWETMSKLPCLKIDKSYYATTSRGPIVSFYMAEEGAGLACGLGSGKVVICKF